MELFYLIDASEDTSAETIEKISDYITKDVKTYDLGNDKIRVSILAYGSSVKEVLTLGDGTNTARITSALKDLRVGGKRELGRAMLTLKTSIISSKGSMRDDAGKVVTIFVAGKTVPEKSNSLRSSAREFEEKNIKVIVVGIGSDVDKEELKKASANPTNVIFVEDDLNIIDPVVSKVTGNEAGRLSF